MKLAAIVVAFLFVGCKQEEPNFSRPANPGLPPQTGNEANASTMTETAMGGHDHAHGDHGHDHGEHGHAEPEPERQQLPAPPDVAAAPADAERTASGLASKVLQRGTGTVHPGARDRVTVHYSGWTTDGNMFDSSVTRGEPAQFPLNRVIRGWTEGVQLMVQGEKRRFWIPGSLAYDGQPGRPQGTLVFDVELLGIERAPEPPAVPDDLRAPPASARPTASGLRSRVVERGTGTRRPTATSRVEVHYTGWRQEDGEMFDSSVTRGQPATFPLNGVIPGWTEGVQLMVEGEKRRLWIPANLAYEGRPGPQGVLVFDVQLLRILD